MNKPDPVIVPPRAPVLKRYSRQWWWIEARCWLYMPVAFLRFVWIGIQSAYRLKRYGDSDELRRWYLNENFHVLDYAQGGPGVMPEYAWWKVGIETDGSPRKAEHDSWVEYILDTDGAIVKGSEKVVHHGKMQVKTRTASMTDTRK